jgi:2-aminoethylphosphonate-pyruvate transaminase
MDDNDYPQERTILLTPGPLLISPEVENALRITHGSRSKAFERITQECIDLLLVLGEVADSHHCVLMQGSGTFCIEATLNTLINRTSDKLLVLSNGIYGERAAQICRPLGISCHHVKCDYDRPISEALANSILNNDSTITHVYFSHLETTTGIINPIDNLCRITREHGSLSIVDGISSYGVLPISSPSSQFDALIGSPNKGIEAPPGIGFVLARKSLLHHTNRSPSSFCLDLRRHHESITSTRQWLFTPPTHVVNAFHVALLQLCAEGVTSRRARYLQVSRRIKNTMLDLGFECFLDPSYDTPVVVSFRLPQTAWFSFDPFYSFLEASGVIIYRNIHHETQTFRIGCLGFLDDRTLDKAMDTIRNAVSALKQRTYALP